MSRQPEKQIVPVGSKSTELSPKLIQKYAFHRALLVRNNLEKERRAQGLAIEDWNSSSSSDKTSPSSALESETDAVGPLIKVGQTIGTLEGSLLNNSAVSADIDSEVTKQPHKQESAYLDEIRRFLFHRNSSLGENPVKSSEQTHRPRSMSDTFRSVKKFLRFGQSKRNSCTDSDTGQMDKAAGGLSADEATTSQPPLSPDESARINIPRLLDTLKTSPMKIRKTLLENGPEAREAADFLVCVTIKETHLITDNKVDSLVVVQFEDSRKGTHVKRNTKCPKFEETFVFTITTTPIMLMQKIITFTVYTYKLFGSNKLLGTVGFDIATVFNQKNAQLYHSWITLSSDQRDASPTAYVNCDVVCFIKKGEDIEQPIPKINVTEYFEANVFAAGGHSTYTTMERMEK